MPGVRKVMTVVAMQTAASKIAEPAKPRNTSTVDCVSAVDLATTSGNDSARPTGTLGS